MTHAPSMWNPCFRRSGSTPFCQAATNSSSLPRLIVYLRSCVGMVHPSPSVFRRDYTRRPLGPSNPDGGHSTDMKRSIVLCIVLFLLAAGAPAPPPAASQTARPNVILILTDDLDAKAVV